MNDSTSNVKKVTIAGVLVAVAVVGSTFSFPVGISRCAPVQHMINIGPWQNPCLSGQHVGRPLIGDCVPSDR